MAAVMGVMTELVSQLASVGPKGMLIDSVGNRVERLYQKISWTSSGVPRKNQMNRPASEWASRRTTAAQRPAAGPARRR
jgi:hypothetical protein